MNAFINTLEHYTISVHYNDVIMSAIASKITSLTIVYSTVYSGADQRKHQRFASLAFVLLTGKNSYGNIHFTLSRAYRTDVWNGTRRLVAIARTIILTPPVHWQCIKDGVYGFHLRILDHQRGSKDFTHWLRIYASVIYPSRTIWHIRCCTSPIRSLFDGVFCYFKHSA